MRFRIAYTSLAKSLFIAIMLLAGSRVFAQSKTGVDSSVPSDAVRTIIGEAIDLGVPLYNSGQPEACLAIYRVALRGLLLLAPEAIDVRVVKRALSTVADQSPERGAWTLRYVLDDLLQKTAPDYVMADDLFRIEFSAVEDAQWYSVNDNVMGGISRGGFSITEKQTGEFSGQLSMQNNGGFSSIRTRIDNGILAGYDGFDLRVRGDGREYTLLVAPSNVRGSWQQKFRAPEEWQILRIPLAAMDLSVRGMKRPFSPPITGGDIGMLGFLIADKQTRPFRMEVDWIQGYVDEVRNVQ